MTHTVEEVKLNETDERARRAVKAFRAMQPSLTGLARALSRNPKVQVVLSQSNGMTDGTRIYYRPPIALGDRIPHDRSRCDVRDANDQLLCQACDLREQVLTTMYHELGHIIFETFGPTTERDREAALRHAIAEHGTKYADKLRAAIGAANASSFIGLTSLVNPYLSMLFNGLEDARIERRQADARPGTRVMFSSKIARVEADGVEVQNADGSVERKMWSEQPLNAQVCVGLYIKTGGYNYQTMFHPDVVTVLNDDQITKLCNRAGAARSAQEIYELGFPILARVRELGYLKSDKEPEDVQDELEPQPEGESEDKSEDSNSSGDDPQDNSDEDSVDEDESESGTSDGESTSGDSSSDDEAAEDEHGSGSDSFDNATDGDSSEPGSDSERSEEHSGSGEPGAAPSQEELDEADDEPLEASAGDDESAVGESPEVEDASDNDEAGGEAAGESTSESSSDNPDPGLAGRDDNPDSGQHKMEEEGVSDEESNTSDSGGDRTSESQVGDGDDEQPGSESDSNLKGSGSLGTGESHLGHEHSSGDSTRTDELSEDGSTAGSDGSTSRSGTDKPDNSADAPSDLVEGEKRDVEIDTGADEGKGGGQIEGDLLPPLLGDESDAEAALLKWTEHEDPPHNVQQKKADERNESAIDKAIIQGLYFETPSENVYGVREHYWNQPIQVEGYNMSSCWDVGRSSSGYSRRSEAGENFETPESLLGPALLKMRVAFADNARASHERNRKSGRVDRRVLGKRAALGDERLFQQKRLPGKKSYHVVIMMDISYSTVGVNIGIMKHAVIAQAHLLDRMGIPFSIYAHTSGPHDSDYLNGVDMEIYVIRDAGEPWDKKMMERIEALGPGRGNLDGHAMEYMRHRLDQVKATHKVGLYYSDGKMPAENHDEELEILQREIRVIQRKRYALLGVGIRTDSPARHGLETVQLDSVDDTGKVITQLRAKLLEIS